MTRMIAEKFGVGFDENGTLYHAFTSPKDLASVSEEEIKMTGFSHQKARTSKELAIGIVTGQIRLKEVEEMTNEEAVEYLSTLRACGRWSAEYVILLLLNKLNLQGAI